MDDDEIKLNHKEDSFIHFTTPQRAEEIIDSGKLLTDPPYKQFGIAGVQAVSVNHGAFIPRVQTDHIKDKIVAIHYKTNTKPKVGFPEEIIWDQDVNLIDPKIISFNDAVQMLKDKDEIDSDKFYTYESTISELLKINGMMVESIETVANNIKNKLNLKTLSLSEKGDTIFINNIIVGKENQGEGLGSKAMQMITNYADKNNKRIVLTPEANKEHGTTSKNRLIKFYKQFGFKENKGKSLDYEIGAGKMYREPNR